MKTFRRAIASTLVLLMVLTSLLTVNVFAETVVFPDVANDYAYKNAIYALVEKGIINGIKDEATGVINFKPEDTVTRAQFAKMLAVKLAGNVELTEKTAQFRDLAQDHWANAYIAYAVKRGIINGIKDEATGLFDFKPEDPVKFGEAVKMLVCAMGYGSLYSKLTPTEHWADGYIRVANQIELTKFAQSIAENLTPRGRVAQLIYNMDYCKTPTITGGANGGLGGNFAFDNDSDLEETSGILEAVFDQTLTGQSMGLNKFQVVINSVTYNIGELSLDKFYPLLGKNVFIRYELGSNKVIKTVEESGSNNTITITAHNISDINGRTIEYYESDTSTKTQNAVLSSDLYIIYNGNGVPKADITDAFIEQYLDVEVGEITLMNNNGGRDYEIAYVTSYTTYYVTGKSNLDDVYTYTDSNNINGSTISIDKDDCENKVFKASSDFSKKDKSQLSSISAKNVISVAVPYGTTDGTEVIVSAVTKTDEVDEISGDDYIVIGGKEYKYSDYFLKLRNNNPSEYTLGIGDKATFYFDFMGNLVFLTKSESTDPYAYVLGYEAAGTSLTKREHFINIYAVDKSKAIQYPVKDPVKVDGKNKTPDELEAILAATAAKNNELWAAQNTNSSADKYIDEYEKYSQLIRYKTSQSNGITFLSEVYTIQNDANNDGTIVPNGSVNGSDADKLTYKNKTFSKNGSNKFAVNDKTVIIQVPADRTDEDKVKKRTGVFTNDNSYLVEAYDIKSNIAKVVIFYSDSSSLSYSNFAFVESVREKRNSDGEIVQELTYYTSGAADSKTILTEKENTLSGVKGGDIIRFAKDGTELADYKKIFADGKLYDASGNVTNYFQIASGTKADYYQFMHGTVQTMDVDSNSLSMKDGDNFMMFTTDSSTKIYRWDEDKDVYYEPGTDLGTLQGSSITGSAAASKVVILVVSGTVKSVYLLSADEVIESNPEQGGDSDQGDNTENGTGSDGEVLPEDPDAPENEDDGEIAE